MPPIAFNILNVKKLFHNIKKSSTGPDGIHSVIQKKKIADELAYPLSIIFTKSLSTSGLLNDCLHSFLCPIYKGSDFRFTSERPISLTSNTCKILESVIKNNIFQHNMLSQYLFTPFQHGFLPKRSTLSALISTHYDWICSLSSSKNTHCIFVDLSKAFESISHRKLMYKLSLYTLNTQYLVWIKAFLHNRTQKDRINSPLYQPTDCFSGTLKGFKSLVLFFSLST